jgi:hypothetical protein
MPTLDDLRAAFIDLEQRSPLPQPLDVTKPAQRAGATRSPGRRGWGAVTLAAASVAVVAAGVAVYAGAGHGAATTASTTPAALTSAPNAAPAFPSALPAPAPGGSPRLSFGFAVDPVAGYRVTPTVIGAASQSADISSSDAAVKGGLQVYYAGAFDPARVERGTPVQVEGRTGYYAPLRLADGADTRYDVLAWQYADGGWAVVYLWDGAAGRMLDPGVVRSKGSHAGSATQPSGLPDSAALRADELRLATATHAGNTAISVPFKITGIDMRVDELEPGRAAGGLTVTAAGRSWDFGWGNSELSPADKPGTDTTTLVGRQWLVYHDRVSGTIMSVGLSAPGFGMTVTPVGATATLADFQEFLAHLGFAADLGDPSTWFAADTAVG